MEDTEVMANVIQLELKYCERCGGLWLRRQGDGGVFCAKCVEVLTGRPALRRGGRPRLPINPNHLEILSCAARRKADGGRA